MKEIMEILKNFSKKERRQIIEQVITEDNYSITDIVKIKELAMTNKIDRLNELTAGMGMRMTAMFGDTTKEIMRNIKQIKSLAKDDIIKSGALKGTKFEKKLLN